jgi:hypothetical protein
MQTKRLCKLYLSKLYFYAKFAGEDQIIRISTAHGTGAGIA